MSFIYYDTSASVITLPLTLAQKKKAIDEFAIGKSPRNVQQTYSVSIELVRTVYGRIRAIEAFSATLMTEGILLKANLITALNIEFPNQADVMLYLVDKMVKYSKKNGTGDWTYYLSQFGG